MENITLGSSLKTFEQLLECTKVKELEAFITKETFTKYDEQGLMPHYLINGIKAYKVIEILKWIKEELVEHYDGFKIVSKFYSYNDDIKKPAEIPQELIHHSQELFEFPMILPPCVYFLLEGIEIVYVGQSINVSARVSQHTQDKDFSKVLYLPIVKENLDVVERFFIERLQPKYNKERFKVNKKFIYEDEKYETLIKRGRA
tara:strand:- start:42 stop:647 length:606 start_codon:yes stop_codon:yes gene_type:complete